MNKRRVRIRILLLVLLIGSGVLLYLFMPRERYPGFRTAND